MPAKRPMKIEDLFDLKAVGRIALSPDAARVVFELKRADTKENKNFVQLMQVDVASGRVRPFTAAGKHSDTMPRWSADGSQLGFISTRDKTAALWVMPMDGGEARRITDRDGNVSDFDWSPDGKRLAYTYQPLNDREKLVRDDKAAEIQKGPVFKHITRLFHKLDGSGYWNGHRTHVYVIDVEDGKSKKLTEGAYDHKEPRFSPDGRKVSFNSNRTANPDLYTDQSDIYVVPVRGGKAERITRMPGAKEGHAWSPDGKTIAFVGARYEHGKWWQHQTRLWTVASSGGEPNLLTGKLDNNHYNETMGDVAGATFLLEPPNWSADGSRLYFLMSTRGATNLYSCRASGGDVRDELIGKHNVMFAQRTRRDGPFALTIGTNTNPGDVYVFEPDTGRAKRPGRSPAATRLTTLNAAVLDRIDVVAPEEFELKSGPVKLQCWVMKPPGFKANKRYPAIMEIHGGPQAQYGYGFFHEMQLLAARGFVVAFTNPRGSAGYGLNFRKSIIGRWGTDDHKDVKRLGDWLFARKYVDPKRVGVTGGSYGGYMTNWIVTHETRYAAACTQRCVSYMNSMFGTSDFGPQIVHEMGGPPWKDDSGLKKQSPLCFVDNCHTPLLIEHEDQDYRCELEQAQQMFTALKYLGREVEMVIFEGESHGLSRGGRPHNRAERLRRISGWFEKWLKRRR